MHQYTEHRAYFETPYIRTPFFKALTPERNLSETKALENLCNFSPDDLILDHGCGQGRHATQLRADGFTVTGFDYSRTLLDMAISEIKKRDLSLPYVRGNMLDLPFKESVFDWVLSLFGSFGYMSDQGNIEVLKEIARVLRPGGRMVLDIWNKTAVLKSYGDDKKHEIGKDKYFIQKCSFDYDHNRMTVNRFFTSPDNEEKYSMSFRVYTRDEITGILKTLGFEIVDFRGSFSSREITTQSRGMVIICKKGK